MLTSFSAFALLVLISSFAFFSTFSTSSAYADPNGSASATADVVLNLTSSISIRTLDSTASSEIESLNLELTPTPSGRFTKDTTVVDVSTSNPSGYKLYMQSDYTDSSSSTPSTPVYTTDMLHSNPSVSDKVANLGSTNVTEVAFSAANSSYRNRWGYSLNGLSVTGSSSPTITPNTNPASIIYNPVPAHANAVTINGGTTSATEHSYTPVTIGANVDTNIVSGTYTNRLVFSTIANPPYVDYNIKFNANVDGQGGASIGRDDGNDGSVTNLPANIAERVMATSYTITIPGDTTTGANVPTRTNYIFSGYNTKPDGTGVTYQPGDTFTLGIEDKQSDQVETASATLYAMWTQYNYTVTIDCNSGTNCPAGTSIATGDSYTYTLSSTTPTRSGYNFKGYLGSDGNTYQPGDTISLNPSRLSITLTAQWAKLYAYSITYACNSGSGCPSNYSETITDTTKSYTIPSTAPTRSGYNFKGYLGSDSTTYQPGGTINLTGGSKESVTLTAQWAQVYNYSVTVNCDSGTGCSSNYSSSTENANFSYNYTISSTVPTKSGYAFNGYKGSDNVTYQPGGTVALSSSKRTVTLTAQWAKLYTYKVTYACNSGSGCPSNLNTTITSTGYSYTIPSTAPTRSGYKFTGYLGSDGNTYQPGGTVTLNTSKLSVTLTAQWEENNFWNITYMQDMTPEICSEIHTPSNVIGDNANAIILEGETAPNTTTVRTVRSMADYQLGNFADGSSYVAQRTLYDYRGADGTGNKDNKVTPDSANAKGYVIRKLADGNCWMTQNLEIPLSTTAGVEVVSNSSGNLAPATPNSTTQQGTITSAGIWTPTGPGGTGNGTTPMNGNTQAANNTYYYSWYAATAGSGLSTDVNTDAPFSICPVGWRLPYNYKIDSSTTSKSYSNMTKAYLNITTNTNPSTGYRTLEAFPLNFARSGYVVSGAFTTNGNGHYWSSTAYSSATFAYSLRYNSTLVYPQQNGTKSYGFIVRCVAV